MINYFSINMTRKILILLHSLISFVTFSQENWSLLDLKVTTFRNGDPLLEVTTEANWKFCNANQIPAYFMLGSTLEDGVLYNFYAVDDPRQLAPEGYRIATLEDVNHLDPQQVFQSANTTWKTKGQGTYFNASGNGYVSVESFNLLSKGDAAYYWTSTIGKSLQSVVFVVMNNVKGYAKQELNRESFCSVRCVLKNGEEGAFDTSESLIKKQDWYVSQQRKLEIDQQILDKESFITSLEKEKAILEAKLTQEKAEFQLLKKEQSLLLGNISNTTNSGVMTNVSTVNSPKKERVQALLGPFVKIEGGTFQMGSVGYDSDEKQHKVQLSTFYMQPTEVSQELYEAVMGVNPSENKSNKLSPVTNVSWEDCQVFIQKLKELTGMNYRLPTEAEWEYAAKGGQRSKGFPYSGSIALELVAWYRENSGLAINPISVKPPNELGLYDMTGNVWEWCQDWYGEYDLAIYQNPQGPEIGTRRVRRGGCFNDVSNSLRVSFRQSSASKVNRNDLGFRLAISYH